jgi:hypothetical protein
MGYSSDQEIQNLVDQFESKVLPLSQWTHHAHLSVGMYYLYNRTFHESLCLMKAHIICYNEATGGVNSSTGGYHETLTVFWLKILAGFLEARRNEPLFKLCNAFLENPLSSKEIPFQYYTKEKLFSVEARAMYLEQEKSD